MNKFLNLDFRYLFLLGLLVFLPGLEALKNIFAFLFVFFWVLHAKKSNDWGGKWQIIDSIFLVWILADITISINAVLTHQLSGSNFRDVLRFVLIGWVLSRSYFTEEKQYYLVIVSLIATMLTLGFGYYSANGVLKELHSVGHINHTAIFLVIAYSVSLSLLLFEFNNLNKYQKVILFLSTLVLFYATIDTNSRATFGLIMIVTLINFIFLIIKSRNFLLFLLFFVIFCIVGASFIQNPPQALKRIIAEGHILQDARRDKIRNFSYYAFRTNPLLGNGFGNYSQIKIEDIKEAIIEDKGVFDSSLYINSSHAHNVYYSYLVAGGLLLFSIFMWFWFYIVTIIIKLLSSTHNEWIVITGISVMLINLIIGWVNTTLHHEHAILSMVIFGLLISEYRKKSEYKN